MKDSLLKNLLNKFKHVVVISTIIISSITLLIITLLCGFWLIFSFERIWYPVCTKPKKLTFLDVKNIENDPIYNSGYACDCGYNPSSSSIGVIKNSDKIQLISYEVGYEGAYHCYKVKVNNNIVGYISKTGNPSLDAMKKYEGYDNPTLADPDKLYKPARIRIFCWL